MNDEYYVMGWQVNKTRSGVLFGHPSNAYRKTTCFVNLLAQGIIDITSNHGDKNA